MTALFPDEQVPNADPVYVELLTNPKHRDTRALLERLWDQFQQHADPQFLAQFAVRTHERCWEMIVGCALLDLGYALGEPRGSGPDFQVNVAGISTHVECTVATLGSGPDALPQPDPSELSVADGPIVLRYRNSIHEKTGALARYHTNGIVSPKEAYIIALNGGLLPNVNRADELPDVIGAVYPLGPLVAVYGIESKRVLRVVTSRRDEVVKKSAAPVSTRVFLDKEYSGISALLFSRMTLWDLPSASRPPLIIIHNRLATVPIPRSHFGPLSEFWVDESGKIESTPSA